MSPKISILKTKFASVLQAIASSIDSKLDSTAAAVSADKLTTPFDLTAAGDLLGTVSIQGNAPVSWSLALGTTGVAAGTYPKVTVDSKGRVLNGALLLAADIPNLDAAKITTGVMAAARIPTLNQNTTGNAATASKLAASRTISMTGDGTWSVPFDGGINATAVFTLSNSGVAAGIYGSASRIPKVTIDGKGRVTAVEEIVVDIPASTAMIVNEYITLAVDGLKTYDLVALLGAGAALFDIKSSEVIVRVKNTEAGSPTLDAYINAESVVVYGIKNNQLLLIDNQSGFALDLYVKVLVQPVTP
jgi:phage-related tail fiber protein